MGSFRLWLFRGLIAVAAVLIATSAIMPWWTCEVLPGTVVVPPFTVKIYQYGLPSGPGSTYIAADVTPFYQTVFAWIYIAASIGLILYSTWLRGRKGKWLLGGTGLVYIAYAAIAVIWIAIRTGNFDLPLQGSSSIMREGEKIIINTSLQFGYYLAYAAGLMCIALALLRNKIIGKPKLGA